MGGFFDGLGDVCVEKLKEKIVDSYKNLQIKMDENGEEKNEKVKVIINLNEIIKDILRKQFGRDATRIGWVGLKQELKELKNVAERAGCSYTGGEVTSHWLSREERDVKYSNCAKRAGRRAVAAAGSKISKLVGNVISVANEFKNADDASNYDMLKREKTNELADTCEGVLSYGAAGFRGTFDPSSWKVYETIFPTITINKKDQIVKLLIELANCKWIINSLFCCGGSADVYKAGLKAIGYTYDKKAKTWSNKNCKFTYDKKEERWTKSQINS